MNPLDNALLLLNFTTSEGVMLPSAVIQINREDFSFIIGKFKDSIKDYDKLSLNDIFKKLEVEAVICE